MKKPFAEIEMVFKFFMTFVYVFLIFSILAFMYALMEDQIHQFIHKKRYSNDELKELAERRESKMKKEREDDWTLVENGIHVKTGLIDDDHLNVVIGSCTSCHSAKLITQNRATRKGWKQMIVWMQETQGLPQLGKNEPLILDYLSKNYAPQAVGRRASLDIPAIKWYILNLDKTPG